MEVEINTDTFKVVKKWWTSHDDISYKLKIRERMAVKIANGVRTWDSITHLAYNDVGFWTGVSYEVTNVPAAPELAESNAVGTMYLKYKIKFTPLPKFLVPPFNTGNLERFVFGIRISLNDEIGRKFYNPSNA